MGMYTELVCAFELKKDTPQDVIDILRFMTGEQVGCNLSKINAHPLFQTDRWRFMLQCDSYYFEGQTHSEVKRDTVSGEDNPSYFVTIRCNLKNYNDEIDKFIDWVKTYIEYAGHDEYFIGYQRYEENKDPELIYV
jgi:hypothetical protein